MLEQLEKMAREWHEAGSEVSPHKSFHNLADLKDLGRFRIVARNSVTTTAGRATWLVRDRCDGTVTRMERGSAAVLDLGLRERIVLTRPQSYLARAER